MAQCKWRNANGAMAKIIEPWS